MEAFCDSTFWDYDSIWNTTNPDFTECFQKTVLVWVPCIFLWILAPLHVYFTTQTQSRNIPWTILNITKLVAITALEILMLVDMSYSIYKFTQGHQVPKVNYYASFILFVTFIMAEVLIILDKRRGVQSSGIMFVFWFLLTASGLVRFRSLFMKVVDSMELVEEFAFDVYMIYYPVVVTMFVLSCLADSPPIFKEVDVEDKIPCPEGNSSYLSKLLFAWFDSLAWFGYHNSLERKNLWALNPKDKSKSVVPIFEEKWTSEVKKNGGFKRPRSPKASTSVQQDEVAITPVQEFHRPSLAKALFRCFGAEFVAGGFLKLTCDLLLFTNPLLLDMLIGFVSNGEPLWKGYLYAVLMLLVAILQSLLMGQYFYKMFIIGLQVRTSLIATIYKKALVLSNSARKSSTVGEIVNLMSVDAQQIMDLAPYLHVTWSSPLQIILALYFLWNTLGPSVLAGLAVMILLLPLSAVLANLLEKLQLKQMNLKDQRVKMMNELLNGIKVLKLYAWEPSFERQVQGVREKELRILKKGAYAVAATSFVWMCAPFLVALASFTTYILIDERHILDASKAFVSVAIFQIISIPMAFLPMMLVFLVHASVSLKRLNTFLCHDEQNVLDITHDESEPQPIVVRNATFSWGLDEAPTLEDINLEIREGTLVAVVGPVGCGKSSLISAFIGDMDKRHGLVNTKGTIAYVPQQAWIQNVTLRDNILFGRNYDRRLFNKCIEACALRADLEMLPGGDQTEIGEKGINLSGGQKQRVSLARAVYNDADIYLLDDPLSAVDAHVGRHIFDNVIGPNGILNNKTRVLVTHGITYLPQVDYIVVLSKGAISEVGNYKELLEKKGAFAEFLLSYLESDDEQGQDVEELKKMKQEILAKIGSPELESHLRRQVSVTRSQTSEEAASIDGARRRTLSHGRSVERSLSRQMSAEDGIIRHVDTGAAELISKETVETGQVQLTVYLYYLKAVGAVLALAIMLFDFLSYGFIVGSNMWLSAWSNDKPNPDGTQNVALRDLRLGVFGGLGLAQAIFVFSASLILAFGSIRASTLLHSDMLANIMKSPMSFFDTTPLGRIVNRFSKDVDVLDNTIPQTMDQFVMSALQVVSTIVVISISTPIFIAVVVPLSIVYFFVQRLYIATSRQLKRLESTYRSPIYSHFSESVTGSSTIRAYGMQADFIQQSERRVDENQIAYFPSVVANRWLAIRLEFLGSLVVFAAALFVVLARDTISPGIVGLSLSYALSLTENLNWMVRMSGEMETNIVAVERMKEYALTPTEKELSIKATKPPSDWPNAGVIKFNKYSLRYRDGLDLVLRGISCNINAGEKIGIVGRTGAGKSSLTLALLRIIEPAAGNIVIDGIDIATIGLHDLRSKLTIIPQDPVLFSGTLRINLDPFDQHSDESLWKALELSHLKDFVVSLPQKLLHEISEGGENLSVGQRQLVCLARALLRKTRVLILDEATAAVDLETDDLIQTTIRQEFTDCTVLTIAHRLNTIMDSTRVMVLDKGAIVEFDTPEKLLANSDSLFLGMAKEAGLA